MIIFAAVVIAFVVFLTIMLAAIAFGNRMIVAEINRDLEEALEAIEIARRVHARRRAAF